MWSISYPGDEPFDSAALTNAVQVITKPRALVELYVISNAAGYVLVLDSANGPHAMSNTYRGRIYPIFANGFVAVSVHGGKQFRNGIWVGCYSTIALAVAGAAPDLGNVMLVSASMRRGMLPNS